MGGAADRPPSGLISPSQVLLHVNDARPESLLWPRFAGSFGLIPCFGQWYLLCYAAMMLI